MKRTQRQPLSSLRRAAQSGDAEAMCEYGDRLADNPATREEGLSWEIRAAERGCPTAANNAAMTCSMLGRPADCIVWLRRAIAGAERDVALSLGVALAAGYGLPRDLASAERRFRSVLRLNPLADACLADLDDAAGFLAMLKEGCSIRVHPRGIGATHPGIDIEKTIAFAGSLRGRTPEFFYWRANLRMERHAHDREAIGDFTRAIRLLDTRKRPERNDLVLLGLSLYWRGFLLRWADDYAAAARDFRRCIRLFPQGSDRHWFPPLREIRQQLRLCEQAVADPGGDRLAGMVRRGRFANALAEARRRIAETGREMALHRTHLLAAVAAFRLGRRAEAARHLADARMYREECACPHVVLATALVNGFSRDAERRAAALRGLSALARKTPARIQAGFCGNCDDDPAMTREHARHALELLRAAQAARGARRAELRRAIEEAIPRFL